MQCFDQIHQKKLHKVDFFSPFFLLLLTKIEKTLGPRKTFVCVYLSDDIKTFHCVLAGVGNREKELLLCIEAVLF